MLARMNDWKNTTMVKRKSHRKNERKFLDKKRKRATKYRITMITS